MNFSDVELCQWVVTHWKSGTVAKAVSSSSRKADNSRPVEGSNERSKAILWAAEFERVGRSVRNDCLVGTLP